MGSAPECVILFCFYLFQIYICDDAIMTHNLTTETFTPTESSPSGYINASGYDELPNVTTAETPTEKMFTEYTEFKVAEFVNDYYLYFICGIGIPGNVACILTLVFMRPVMSSTILMLCLAAIDSVAIALKMIFFQLTAFDIQMGARGCQLIFLFGTVSQQFSNWILVAMTIERFIAIWFPFKVKKICNKRNAVIILACMLIFFVLANLQFLFTFEEVDDPFVKYDCRPKEDHATFVEYVWYWIDGVMYAFLPITLIIVFNTLIIYAVRKSNKEHRDLTNRAINMSDKLTQQRQLTLMLLTISLVFVILILPNCIFFIVRTYWSWRDTMRGIAQYYLVYQTVFLLSDLNHAVNFYLYCLSGRKFRQKFIQILCCKKNKPRRNPRSYYSNLANMGRGSRASMSGLTSVTVSETASRTSFSGPLSNAVKSAEIHNGHM